MMTLDKYEGKTKEEALEKCLCDLNIEEQDLFIKYEEQEGKIFKSKKVILQVLKKSDVIEYIKNYISDIAYGLNIEIKSEIKENDGIINITLVSDNNAILIGKDGKTVNSLQLLLKQSLISQTGMNLKINLDASNYKSKKISNLKYQINNIAKEVLNTKVEVKIDPMNSYERRIVHTVIAEYENLETESIGEEPDRYVIIKYRED